MKQKGFTIFELLMVIIVVFILGSWIVNLYKFMQCDFDTPLRCEVIHGIGIFPPIAPFVVFADTDNE